MQVLLLEDNAEPAAFITSGLSEIGWQVERFATPEPASLRLGGGGIDLAVFARMLPGMDGLDVLRLVRGAGVTVPVLMLTARAGLDDRVAGLDAGADDYLVKPFAMAELIARLKTLARRPPQMRLEAPERVLGDLRLDRVGHRAERGGQPLDLSPLEFKLLDCLMAHEGEVVTRTMLLEKVWGYAFDPKTSLVQTHLSRLRAKVDRPFDSELIRTVRGAGYVLGAP